MALIEMNFLSRSLFRTVQVRAIIPFDKIRPGQESGEKPAFKTLYLLHGLLGSDMDWISGTRIQRWAEAKNLAVIMPAGENSFYFNQGYGNENYGDFIGKELVEATRKVFPLSTKREDTFIGGLSMGGYGATMNGFRNSETFGGIISLSGALNIFTDNPNGMHELDCFKDRSEAAKTPLNHMVALEQMVQEGRPLPKMYIACGLQDGLLTASHELRDACLKHGMDVTYDEQPGGHDWEFWDMEIHKALDWLPLGEVSEGLGSGNVHKL